MDFQQVVDGLQAQTIILVDVRNPDELSTLGKIPGSINLPREMKSIYYSSVLHFQNILIPVPNLRDFLQLTEDEFQGRLGFQKPHPQDSR